MAKIVKDRQPELTRAELEIMQVILNTYLMVIFI